MNIEQLVLSLDIPARLQIVAWVTITEAQTHLAECKNGTTSLSPKITVAPFLKVIHSLGVPSEDYFRVMSFLYADSELFPDA